MHKVDDTAWLLVRHYRRNPSSGVTHAQGGRHSVVCWSATTAVIRHQELHRHKVDDTAWLLVRHYRRNPSSGVTQAQGGRHSVVVGPPLPP